MTILDRLLPAWRNSDPEVRVAAIRDLDAGEDKEVLVNLARTDPDTRVRREAVKRLDDAATLVAVAEAERDAPLEALARARAADLFLKQAIGDHPEAECRAALQRLERPSHVVAVATRAHHPAVRRAALARVTEPSSYAEIARRGRDVEIGCEAVRHIDDVEHLARVASANTPIEVANAAIDRIDDAAVLLDLAEDRQAQKAVRKYARQRLDRVAGEDHPLRIAERRTQRHKLIEDVAALREADNPHTAGETVRRARAAWSDLDAKGAADPQDDSSFHAHCEAAFHRIAWLERRNSGAESAEPGRDVSERERLCEHVESLSGPDTPALLDKARADWNALGVLGDRDSVELATRFEAAVERCRQRHERWSHRHDFHDRLATIVDDAEKLVAIGDPRRTERAHRALEKRWTRLASSPAAAKWLADERELQRRFDASGEALREQARARKEERSRRERSARDRVDAYIKRLDELLGEDAIKPAIAERLLSGFDKVLRALREIPGSERGERKQRIETAREELIKRVSVQTTEEEWKRWANADAQRKLIERAEELLESGDAAVMLTALAGLDRDWKKFASAPRKESQKLWDRFRQARNEIRRRCDAFLAENLAKREALIERAEALADSTEWNATAEEFRKLQSEWKQIGPVRRRIADALFERFRTPANAFFQRREVVVGERRERFRERLSQVEALRDAALALAESSDWESAADEIKRLQGEFRKLAPRGGDTLQKVVSEFRGACDSFFERYRKRDEIEAAAKASKLEDIVVSLESLRDAANSETPPSPEDIAKQLAEGLTEWGRRGTVPAPIGDRLEARVREACGAIEAACPVDLEDVGFDTASANAQREKLCTKLEKLCVSFADRAADAEAEPQDLGQRLRLAMAANTIGGSAAPPREQALRDDITAAEKVADKWQRLAPVVGKTARSLEQRFAAARERFDALRREHGFAPAAQSRNEA